MNKIIKDEFSDLPVSRQRKLQLRWAKKGKCIICGRKQAPMSRTHCRRHQKESMERSRRRQGCKASGGDRASILRRLNSLAVNGVGHPGLVVKEALFRKGITAKRLASEVGDTSSKISLLLTGRSYRIKPETAMALEKLTGTPVSYWASISWNYEMALALKENLRDKDENNHPSRNHP